MMTSINKPLFFSGSNSQKSINRSLIEALAQRAGYSNTNIIDLRNFPMPMYSDTEEEKGIPHEAGSLLEIIENHDTLIIAVPEHNSGMPAFFKNIVDWMSRARKSYKVLSGKKVVLICASPGYGGTNTLLNTKIVLEAIGAEVIEEITISHFFDNITIEDNQLHITDSRFTTRFDDMFTNYGISQEA